MASPSSNFSVLTPIWRPRLAPEEEWCVDQTSSALREHLRFFIHPTGMDISWYRDRFPEWHFLDTRDQHLASQRAYNQWILTPEVYNRSDHEFLLLAQTDAFVIRRLEIEPSFKWDYLGAPWDPPMRVAILGRRIFAGSVGSRIGHRRITVGNGGLSLRRVSKFRSFTRDLQRKRLNSQLKRVNEDVVIGAIGPKLGLDIPPAEVAEKYFLDKSTAGLSSFPDIYGAHGLYRWNPSLFRGLRDHES